MGARMSALADRLEGEPVEVEQEVTPLELFFDLVFVFAITQVTGFVSADADYTGAEFFTPTITFSGPRLELNVDCSAMGEVWVEVLDANNVPIPGYTLRDSVSVDRNQIAAPVTWREHDSVGELIGRPVKLHFKLRACKLYAFQFGT